MLLNLIIYICVLIFSLIPAIYNNNAVSYLPFIFVLLLSVFSFIYNLILMQRFTFAQDFRDKVYVRGVKSNIAIKIFNSSFMIYPRVSVVFFVCGADNIPKTMTANVSIAQHEEKLINFNFVFEHIGEYTVGIQSIKIYGLIGILGLKYKNLSMKSVNVKPRLVELNYSIQNGSENINALTRSLIKNNEEDNYNGVRDYAAGDPIKNIHWKLSAHSLKYMTRVFDNSNINGMNLLIDLTTPDYTIDRLLSIYDCLIESSLSLAYCGIKQKNRTQVIFRQNGKMNVLTPHMVSEIEDAAINDMKFDRQNGIAEYIANGTDKQTGFDNVIICTATLSNELIYNLAFIKSMNKNPVLVYSVPANYDPKSQLVMLEFLMHQGVEHYIIKNAGELKICLES